MFYYTNHHFVYEAHALDQNKYFELNTSIFKEEDLQCDLCNWKPKQNTTVIYCK